jgi:hypothetical protein
LKCVTPINLSPHDNNEVNDEINVEVHIEANIEVNLVANIESNVAVNDVPFTTLRLHARWLDMLRLEWLMPPLTKTMPKRMKLIFNECLLGEIFLDFPYTNTFFACKDSILDEQRLHLEIHYLTNGWYANLLTMSFCTLPENVMYPFR